MNPNLITPAMLNFMQSEQQPANQMELLNESPQMQPNTQINENNDPFNSGIRRAIDTARESLGMTEKQKDKSLRRGLLNFAANIAQTPKQKGFFNNWGAASRAAIPALMEYDNAESQYEAQNNAMAQQIQNEQRALRKEEFDREKFDSQQRFQGDQLAETKRYHDLNYSLQEAKANAKQASSVSPLGNNFAPIESKPERANYSKLKQSTGEILGDLQTIKKEFDGLQELTKNDLINPMNPYVGSYANKTKDFISYLGKDSTDKNAIAEREKSVKRKAFEAEVHKFQVEFERKLKGGVLGKGIIEIFDKKKMLPSVGDAPDIFNQKLQDLNEMISNRYEAADNSLRYNTHISPYDMDEVRKIQNVGKSNPKNENEALSSLKNNDVSYVVMTNQKTGESLEVPDYKVGLFEANGYE
jgi:hypothetical protein